MRIRGKYLKLFLNLFMFARFWDGDPNEPGTPGGGGGGEEKINFSGEVVEIPDPKSGNKIKIPKEIADPINALIGHSISTTRDKVRQEYEPLIEKLKSESANYEEVQAELDKLKEANMTAEQKAEANAAKVIREHERTAKTATEEAAKWKDLFERSTIKTDIYGAFGDAKLFNPKQVALLFENEGKAKITEKVDSTGKPTGEFETVVKLMLEDKDGKPEEVEGTPEQTFKRWIELERNFYLRQADIKSGGGTPPSRQGQYSQVDWDNMTPSQKVTKARELGIKGGSK